MTAKGLAVVSLSGGMDSTTLVGWYRHLAYPVLALSADYGQRHRDREIQAAAKVAHHYQVEHDVVDLRHVGGLLTGSALTDPAVDVPEGHYAWETMKATVVPNRNSILASILVGVGVARGAELVAMGMHAGDHAVYPDCRPRFVEALARLVEIANDGFGPPRIEAPFIHMSKTQIASTAARIGAPLHLSWSCYVGGKRHCGRCGTCYERREAFRDAGLDDPTEYEDATTVYPATQP